MLELLEQKRISRTTCLYGNSGSGKTLQTMKLITHYVKHYYSKHKAFPKIRVIWSSGGGLEPLLTSKLAQKGCIDVFPLLNLLQEPLFQGKLFSLLQLLSQGYWYRNVQPGTGNFGENKQFYLYMDDICKLKKSEQIQMYVIDDISTLLGRLIAAIGQSDKDTFGFKHSFEISLATEALGTKLNLNGLQQGHYGIAYTYVNTIIQEGFNKLDLDWVVYTTLVQEGERKSDKAKLFGPAMVGKAATEYVPSFFSDTIYLERNDIAAVDANGQTIGSIQNYKGYITNKIDAELQVPYLTNFRSTPSSENVAKINSIAPYGVMDLTANNNAIAQLYELVFPVAAES